MSKLSPDNTIGQQIVACITKLNEKCKSDKGKTTYELTHESLNSLHDAIITGRGDDAPLLDILKEFDPERDSIVMDEYRPILNVIKDRLNGLSLFKHLEVAGVFKVALQKRDPAYLKMLYRYTSTMVSLKMVSPDMLASYFESGADVDRTQRRGQISLWTQLARSERHSHIQALISKGLHRDSESFHHVDFVHAVLSKDLHDIMNEMIECGVNVKYMETEDDEYLPLDHATGFNASHCLDLMFSSMPDDCYKGYEEDILNLFFLPVTRTTTVETFLVLDHHATRFGIDLETLQNEDGETLASTISSNQAPEVLRAYDDFMRIRLAHKNGESVGELNATHMRPRL